MDNRFIHMIPLLFFTALAIIASGLVIGTAIMMFMKVLIVGGREFLQVHRELWYCSFILAALGTIFSLFHLGRKERFWRAMLGISHSWLSREVVLAGLLVGSAGTGYGLMLVEVSPGYVMSLAGIAGVSALLLTWTIGMVYHLPGRTTWRGLVTVAAPLVTALAGAAVLPVFFIKDWQYLKVFLVIWVIDILTATLRAQGFFRLKQEKKTNIHFVFPQHLPFVFPAHMARLSFTLVLLIAVIFSWHTIVATVMVTIIFLDRYCLYSGALQVSPRVEMASLRDQRLQDALQ